MLWRWIEAGSRSALYLSIPTALLFGAMKEADSLLLIAAGALLVLCGSLADRKRMVSAGTVLLVTGALVFIVLLRYTAGTAGTAIVSPWGPWNSYLVHRSSDLIAWVVLIPIPVLAVAMVVRALNKFNMSWGELIALLVASLSVEIMRMALYYISFSMTYDGYNDAIGARYGYPLALFQALVAAVVLGRLANQSDGKIISGVAKVVAIASCLSVLIINKGLFSPSTLKSRDWWLQFNTDADRAVSEAARLLLEARKENKNPLLIATGAALEWEPKLSLIMFLKRKMPDTVVYFDPNEKSASTEFYGNLSIKFGGTPMSPEIRTSIRDRGCVDVHVDEQEYSNPDCTVLNIMTIASRPAP
jgi:hypothetical protein